MEMIKEFFKSSTGIAAGISILTLILNIFALYIKPEFERKSKNKDRYAMKQYEVYEILIKEASLFINNLICLLRKVPLEKHGILIEGNYITGYVQKEIDRINTIININTLYIESNHDEVFSKWLKQFAKDYSSKWGQIAATMMSRQKKEINSIKEIVKKIIIEKNDIENFDIIAGEVLYDKKDIFNMLKFNEINQDVIYENGKIVEDNYERMISLILQYEFREKILEAITPNLQDLIDHITIIKNEFRSYYSIRSNKLEDLMKVDDWFKV